jgi:hypothetical protein
VEGFALANELLLFVVFTNRDSVFSEIRSLTHSLLPAVVVPLIRHAAVGLTGIKIGPVRQRRDFRERTNWRPAVGSSLRIFERYALLFADRHELCCLGACCVPFPGLAVIGRYAIVLVYRLRSSPGVHRLLKIQSGVRVVVETYKLGHTAESVFETGPAVALSCLACS